MTIWRILVERTVMINNDEVVRFDNDETHPSADYSTKETRDLLAKHFHDKYQFRLRVCRPVFSEEIAAGLDTSFGGSIWDEKTPDITKFIDGFWKMLGNFEFAQEYWDPKQFNLSAWIAEYAATNYYDCMSGGCDQAALSIMRHLCETLDVDLDQKVYPKTTTADEDAWSNLRDFCDDVDKSGIPKYNDLLNGLGLNRGLPLKEKLLLETVPTRKLSEKS